MTRTLIWLGVAGPDRHERSVVHRCYRVFQWVLLPLLIWLPVDLYLRSHDTLNLHLSEWFDRALWSVVCLELLVMLVLVDQPLRYLRQNWVSVALGVLAFPWFSLGSIPEWLFLLRVLAAAVLVAHWSRLVLHMLRRRRLAPLFLAMFLVAMIGGLLAFAVEPETFKAPENGIWFAIVTMATVGYGEFSPVSFPGRLIAAGLMAVGVALVALLAGRMAAYFEEQSDDHLQSSLDQILAKLELIETRLRALESQRGEASGAPQDGPVQDIINRQTG